MKSFSRSQFWFEMLITSYLKNSPWFFKIAKYIYWYVDEIPESKIDRFMDKKNLSLDWKPVKAEVTTAKRHLRLKIKKRKNGDLLSRNFGVPEDIAFGMIIPKARYHALLTAEYQAYLNSPEWKAFAETLKRFIGKCQLCGDKKQPKYNVHHNTYENLKNEDLFDVIVLCPRCHYGYHSWIEGKEAKGNWAHRNYLKYK